MALHSRWLREAGAAVAAGVDVEISPLWALDAAEVMQGDAGGTDRTSDVYWRVIADAARRAGRSAAAKRDILMLHAVILAGGSGTRLWPASRRPAPSSFSRSRATARCSRRPWTVWAKWRRRIASSLQRPRPWPGAVREELAQLPPGAILAEPCPRNTAPCIGLAAIHVLRSDPDATLAVLPADQIIAPLAAFQETLRAAAALVEEEPRRLVTFGIKPQSASTGFGYIERDEAVHATP